MREFDAFSAITRRALSINYKCPLICELVAESSGSGSGGSVTATLDIDATLRKAGPAEIAFIEGFLTWSSLSYALGYVVYFSYSAEGPFSIAASNVISPQLNLQSLETGTWFFKVTGLEPDFGETFPSPILGPIIIT